MRIGDMARMSLSNLWKRKVRTLLTVMGVVIGTCAIVVMISLGLGMQKTMQDSLAQMGDLTVIQIYNYNSTPDSEPLDDSMLEQIRAIDHVTALTPSYDPTYWGAFQIESGKYVYSSNITGVDMDALEAFGYQVQEGALPTSENGNYEGLSSSAPMPFIISITPKRARTPGLCSRRGRTRP